MRHDAFAECLIEAVDKRWEVARIGVEAPMEPDAMFALPVNLAEAGVVNDELGAFGVGMAGGLTELGVGEVEIVVDQTVEVGEGFVPRVVGEGHNALHIGNMFPARESLEGALGEQR